MSDKNRYLTDDQLVVVGRRYRCDAVGLEASEVAARWRRDVGVLSMYGQGEQLLTAFEADLARHAALRAARPDAVAVKKTATIIRDQQISRGWLWVDRVKGILGGISRTDQAVAMALKSSLPTDDAGLVAGIQAMAKVLGEHKDKALADSQVEQRLGEVDAICKDVQASLGSAYAAKGHTVADTEQIDLYDGKLYVRIRDLNEAGRAAIRNGDLVGTQYDYTFHHLKRSGSPTPPPTPPTPVSPTGNTAVS